MRVLLWSRFWRTVSRLNSRGRPSCRSRRPSRPVSARPTLEALEERIVPSALAVIDDFGNTFATAQPLGLSPNVPTVQPGALETVGDVDYFRFVAPSTGIIIAADTTPATPLATQLTVFDASQQP